MAARPAFLDLRSKSHDRQSGALPSPRPLLSPRLHVPGDIPPDLSPLDAFAAHSRALAKQLEEETTKDGSRLSRLPSLTIANKLNTSRPGYFRSASTVESTAGAETSPISGEALALLTEIEAPGFRPVSHYPRMSGIEEIPPFESPVPPSRSEARPEARPEPHDDEERYRGRKPITLTDGPGYFGARREESPGVLQRENRSPRQGNSPRQLHHTPSADSLRRRGHTPRRPQDGSLATGGYDSRALAPPRSPMFAQRTPSPGSASMTSDYDDHSSLHNSNGQQNRKLSSGSQFSTTSPISPVMYTEARSPSISSEISVGGGVRLPRPAFNFSRPLSSQSLPPVELPSRQASEDSQPSFVLADDTAHTPVSMHSDGFPDTTSENGGAPSYVYSRFSLPRGKMLQRNSLIFQPELPNAQFQWEQPVPYSNVQTLNGGSIQAPPSPPSRPSTSSRADSTSSVPSQTRPSLDPGRPSFDPSRPSYDRGRSTDGRGRPSTEQSHPMSRFVESSSSSISPSTNSESTIKGAMSTHSLAPSAEQSAEKHVAKAIECHEAGALKESTYHLRLAARQNHPTGMLLYALACRHGWGMRPNQREGVAWLKKAADCASLEVADDEDLVKDGKAVDVLEKKTRKAQFALSIYELGVSHMNGWGIEQDKVLALRCFEIAGSWGDADALAEAGFCYAQGVGCKKDLKRSAKFYRQAEAKGISMIGNSWIYKAKYNDDEEEDKRAVGSPEKKGRNKSRTRWGRMKSHN